MFKESVDVERGAQKSQAQAHYPFHLDKKLHAPLHLDGLQVAALKRSLNDNYAHGHSNIGYWELNINTGEFYLSEQLYAIHQLDPEEPLAFHALTDKMTPESHLQSVEEMKRLIENDVQIDSLRYFRRGSETYTMRLVGKKYLNDKQEIVLFGIAELVPCLG